jgi:hypothetical protein
MLNGTPQISAKFASMFGVNYPGHERQLSWPV